VRRCPRRFRRLSRFQSAAILLAGLLLCLAAPARADLAYETTIRGIDGDVLDTLKQTSQLVALEDDGVAAVSVLRRRADSDLDRLKQVMNSEGYYDAGLTADISSDERPVAVTIEIQPGPCYTLAKVTLRSGDAVPLPMPLPFDPGAVGLSPGQPARAAPVVAAEAKIAALWTDHGWPFARIADREVVVDSATHTMDVTYTVDPGQAARFGKLIVEGLTRLDPLYVERRVKWRQGDPYDRTLVDKTRQTLIGTGLFGTVVVAPDPPVGSDGTVAMRITLAERALRTIGAGLSYDTSLGPQANVSWEHRDLFGGGEDFTATAKGGKADSGLDLKFRRPDAFWTDQDFVAELSADNELLEAFRSLHEELQLGFQQHFTPTLTLGYGIEAEHARINEIVDTRTYTLVGLPLSLKQDDTDDLLNPTRGYRAGLKLTPYLAPLGSDLTYVQGVLTGSTYLDLADPGAYVLALEGTLGASAGASLASIPKDHRLFAGGGGSVRGFAFQRAGPLDQYYNSIGGRSLLVGTVELRTRITPTIGLVPFFDAGSDYPTPLPTLDGKLYMGAGIGLRYFTAIGPLRLDLATPIDPHDKGDAPIQIYVSIGQAF
jgi:translocation and assembly module TamA